MAMSSPPSSTLPTETLFDKDGICLSATALSLRSGAAADADDDGDSDSDGGGDDRGGIILTLGLRRHQEKNVINPTMISLLVEALDAIESHPKLVDTNNKALIVTGLPAGGNEDERASKFFSNGLDLEWMLAGNNTDASGDTGSRGHNPTSKMIESFNSEVLARVLTLPFRTVAAINGHCIGAGLFLALACDYRIMRTERGYIQWPEARLGMRLTKGFAEISKAKISDQRVLREGILTAKKYTSAEALASGIIDEECPMDGLYDRAFQLAKEGLPESPSGTNNLDYFDPKTYTEIKIEMYTDAYRALKFGKVMGDLPHSRI